MILDTLGEKDAANVAAAQALLTALCPALCPPAGVPTPDGCAISRNNRGVFAVVIQIGAHKFRGSGSSLSEATLMAMQALRLFAATA